MVTLHELNLNADGGMMFEFEGGISSVVGRFTCTHEHLQYLYVLFVHIINCSSISVI